MSGTLSERILGFWEPGACYYAVESMFFRYFESKLRPVKSTELVNIS